MTKTKKRGERLPDSVAVLIRFASVFGITAIAAAAFLLASSAVIYQTDDPAAHIDIGAYAALALTAVTCGTLSSVLCRESAFTCALCTSGAIVCIMLAVAALSGGVAPICVTVYAGFMLASVLFAWLFARGGTRRHKKRR